MDSEPKVMSVNNTQDVWSLGCDITVSDMGVVIQETSVDDISLSGSISIQEIPVNIDTDKKNILDLDINVMVDGFNSSIVESQVVPYSKMLGISSSSPEAISEKRFAASAYSARKLKDLIESLEDRVGGLEESEGEGGGLTEDVVKEIQKLRDLLDSWFEYDATTNMLKANYGIYSFGPLVAGGKANGVQISAVNKLSQLKDVQLSDPKDGESLVFDDEGQKWINALTEGGEGGSAKLESDITADVAVGNIKKGVKLTEGMTITEILTMMFSQAIINVNPTVKITNTPKDCEVGTIVTVNPRYTYTDGKYKTSSGEIAAGCAVESTKYYLEDNEIETPCTLETSEAKQYKVQVGVRYGASTAEVKTASGEEYTDKIKAGTVTDVKTFNVGYRYFLGYMSDADYNAITSESIRALTNTDIINPSHVTVTLLNGQVMEIPAGLDIIIAVPDDYILEDVRQQGENFGFAVSFKTADKVVNCLGDITKNYTVYRYDNQSAYPMFIDYITIKKK